MKPLRAQLLSFVTIAGACAIAGGQQPCFIDLGLGAPYTNAYWPTGVSDDGQVVVGQYNLNPPAWEAFVFRIDTGMIGQGHLPGGGLESNFWAVSGDGLVATGLSDTPTGLEAVRWTELGGLQPLGFLPGGGTYSEGNAASRDGAVIAGGSDTSAGFEAFRWTPSGGLVGLGHLPGGGLFSTAYGVSADGSVIVGGSDSAGAIQAFRWTALDGMVSLGSLPGGGDDSFAQAVSADGRFVVGDAQSATSGSDSEPFLWRSDTGLMIGLGDLPGGTTKGSASAVSDDGRIVVGNIDIGLPFSEPDEPLFGHAAFIWDEVHGMRNLQDYLEVELGVDIPDNMVLHSATGISSDGTVIVGWGTVSTERRAPTFGWIACIRVPSCPADLNGDGLVDFIDYLVFLNYYDIQDLRVDYTRDGLVDFSDYLEFLNHYDAGC